MSSAFNFFRYLGDFCHFSSKAILIFSIHWLRSTEGVSLLSQSLYLAVFLTRYFDIFWNTRYVYNTVFKILYIASSMYTIFLQTHVFRPAFGEKWRGTRYIVIFSIFFAFVCSIPWRHANTSNYVWTFFWTFSLVLESVAIIPQLALLTQLQIPTVITSYYLVSLGLYRAFYILNWIYRAASSHWFEPVPVIFGVLQTALYAEFFWIFYRRQRIKLGGGEGTLDEEDLKGGWLLGKVILGGSGGSDWGVRERISQLLGRSARPSGGLSVRADDTLERGEGGSGNASNVPFEDEPGTREDHDDAGVLDYADSDDEDDHDQHRPLNPR